MDSARYTRVLNEWMRKNLPLKEGRVSKSEQERENENESRTTEPYVLYNMYSVFVITVNIQYLLVLF